MLFGWKSDNSRCILAGGDSCAPVAGFANGDLPAARNAAPTLPIHLLRLNELIRPPLVFVAPIAQLQSAHFKQNVMSELRRQHGVWGDNRPQISSILVVQHAIFSRRESAQFDFAFPWRRWV